MNIEKFSIHKSKTEPGSYDVFLGAKHVASISKTGTHLDWYPWDWMLLDGVEVTKKWRAAPTGVADTLRSAKNEVASALGWYSWDYEN